MGMKKLFPLSAGLIVLTLSNLFSVSLTWDPGFTGGSGGTGTWTTLASGTNWWNGSTDIVWTAGNDAVFAGTAGTVTITATGIAPNSITINTGGYTLTADASRLITVGGLTTAAGSGTTTIGANFVFNLSGTTRTFTIGTGDTVNFQSIIRDNVADSTAGLTKDGGGTLLLSIAASSGTATTSSYRGATTINAGTVRLGVANALNTHAAAGGVVVSGGALDLQTFNQTLAAAQLTSGSIIGTTGTLTSLTNYDLQSGTVSARLAGSVGVNKSGSGTVALTGVNTYTGPNTITGGILRVNADSGLGAAPVSGTSNIIMDGGTLQWGAVFNLNANREIVLNAGGGTLDTNGFGPTVGLTMAISGSGSLTKAGEGTITLGASKTYTGGTIVTGGTLRFSVSNVLPTSGNVTVNGGVFEVGAQQQTTSGTAILISGAFSGSSTGAVRANAFDLRNGIVTARLQDNAAGASLTKSTTGTVTLSGSNSYTGSTTISNGTLIIAGGASIGDGVVQVNGGTLLVNGAIGNGGVTVASGATLAGGGTINGAVSIGGTISPGNSPGTLTEGATTLLSTGHFILDLATDGSTGTAGIQWDKLVVNGALDISSLSSSNKFTFDLATYSDLTTSGPLVSWDANTNHTWSSIVTFTSLTGTFASNLFTVNTSGFQNSINGTFSITQNGNAFDLAYTAVPEPAVGGLVLAGCGLMLVVRRLRKQSSADKSL